ncbi:MAG TPA: hypothetical protein VMD51_12905 [Mycobacterium sp.]|nr:hypothetical protein [Mycobacterium sp.]
MVRPRRGGPSSRYPGQLPVTIPDEPTAVMAAQPDRSGVADKYS